MVAVGDITDEGTDAIVNAANKMLLGGSGVDGAIHQKGGPQIREECLHLRNTIYPDGLPTGAAVITTGGLLRAKHVIHTVGPIYGRNHGRDAELLANCYRSSLTLAKENGIRSISFPSISTGVYGYPKAEAARVVSETLESAFADLPPVELVRLVFFHPTDAGAFVHNARF